MFLIEISQLWTIIKLVLEVTKEEKYLQQIEEIAKDILESEGMNKERLFAHHGDISCFEHSLKVTLESLYIKDKFNLTVDETSLIRGALLHDYYLYDWHIRDKSHRLHGFFHAEKALHNACRDFHLNKIEKDIIRKHMFPLNLALPRYKESWIVTLADKKVATKEVIDNIIDKFLVRI